MVSCFRKEQKILLKSEMMLVFSIFSHFQDTCTLISHIFVVSTWDGLVWSQTITCILHYASLLNFVTKYNLSHTGMVQYQKPKIGHNRHTLKFFTNKYRRNAKFTLSRVLYPIISYFYDPIESFSKYSEE